MFFRYFSIFSSSHSSRTHGKSCLYICGLPFLTSLSLLSCFLLAVIPIAPLNWPLLSSQITCTWPKSLVNFPFLSHSISQEQLLLNTAFKNIWLPWWHMPVILALDRLRQEDGEFQTNLGYIVSSRPTWTT
jgi:hypothetical protein